MPIYYEGRLPKLHVEGESLDKVFDRVFAELSQAERKELKKKYATEPAITGAPQRIEKICLDILEHYEKFIRPNGFKAQIVAIDRKTAVLYKKTLDKLRGPKSVVTISEDPNDTDDDMIVIQRDHLPKVISTLREIQSELDDIIREEAAAS